MAQRTKPAKSKIKKNVVEEINQESSDNKQTIQDKGFISITDIFFRKNLNLFFILSLILTIILGIYLFDVKIHEGGDDSNYIEMAYNFLKGKSFPSWHGEFYSIFLSLPILIFGLNVVVLKIFSFFFMIGHLIFFYLAFKNRISSTLLVFILLIISVSTNIIFFSSQTYTEGLFMFLQALGIFYLFKLIDNLSENKLNNLDLWPYWLVTGFIIFLLATTRNIGITFLIGIIVLFLFTRKFYAILYIIAGYYIFSLPFQLYKRYFWHIDKSTMSQQLDAVLLKNPYNSALGTEDFSGMVTRFIENTKIYLSRYFFQSVGLKDPSITDSGLFPAIILLIIFLIGFYIAVRKNKHMLFLGIYLGGSVITTFITLAQSWGQLRMIVIFVPLILLFASWTIYELSKIQKLKVLFVLLLVLFVFIFFKTLGQSIKKAKENQKVLAKNMAGNRYYGFTPDWINFLKMSEWVSKNIPDSVGVASRKPSMSFIYGKGKEFYGIYRMPTENGDSLMETIKKVNNDVCIFNLNELNLRKVPNPVQLSFKSTSIAFMAVGTDVFGIFDIQDSYKEQFMSAVNDYKIENYVQPEIFMDYVHRRNEAFYGVQPDSLLNSLKRNKVRYAIIANLRMNPKMKTGNIVSTVQRYLYFIELKYPGLFTLAHQVGANEDEPAQLVMINYERFGL